MSWLLLLLWFVPLGAFLWARKRAPHALWRITGVALGAVISPAALASYGFFYWGPFFAIFSLIGGILELVHAPPGYYLALLVGLVPPGTVVQGQQHLYVELLTGLVWAPIYGAIGWRLDRRTQHKHSAEASAPGRSQ
jgi:hypothetical protein